MTVADDLREQLKQLGLDTRGNKSTLKTRLRKHHKKDGGKSTTNKDTGSNSDDDDDKEDVNEDEESTSSKPQRQEKQGQQHDDPNQRTSLHKNSMYDFYLCFDVEATCELGFRFEFPSEVIEFPVVLLDGSTLEIVDEFHSYVRPTHRPILSDFCKDLTGISQETVDSAPTFVEVLERFEEWLTSHRIIASDWTRNDTTAIAAQPNGKKKTYCFVTDGPFDIRDFISKQCLHSNILRPSYFAHPYIDVRTMFRDYFDLIQWKNLERMLGFLGESFQGRQHSGICDARMVALIAKRLALGFRKEDNDPIFQEENMELVAPQWSDEKTEKFKQGCMLKANRSTNNTFIKMISFKKVEQIEALPSAIAAGKAAPPPPPKPPANPGGRAQGDGDDGDDALENMPVASTFPLPSLAESVPTSPIAETFVSESKFSALMMSSE
ncbi:MAG: ribonuclease H-like domain-containing protein [Linnemannia gamsii]|nr:MAG: ribonuclease H-like domain-containing protein [Linnemannia gamsii]